VLGVLVLFSAGFCHSAMTGATSAGLDGWVTKVSGCAAHTVSASPSPLANEDSGR
jgi:hypothetical protein